MRVLIEKIEPEYRVRAVCNFRRAVRDFLQLTEGADEDDLYDCAACETQLRRLYQDAFRAPVQGMTATQRLMVRTQVHHAADRVPSREPAFSQFWDRNFHPENSGEALTACYTMKFCVLRNRESPYSICV